ncbi:MAG: glycerophosphodiester phosphodiesterase family protein, partial [Anaerotignaceae bacterium]
MKNIIFKNKKATILGLFFLLLLFVWLNNTSIFYSVNKPYKILAHRGLAQTFDISQVDWDTNTAQIIYEPEHNYLENTIDSMAISFDYGAQMVELDIQLTKDKQLAVFHDYDLSMRTNGTGSISDYTMEELKALDIGYGYTADGGKSYPFRNRGYGLMPELKEV